MLHTRSQIVNRLVNPCHLKAEYDLTRAHNDVDTVSLRSPDRNCSVQTAEPGLEVCPYGERVTVLMVNLTPMKSDFQSFPHD
jgi:hypothetical protein